MHKPGIYGSGRVWANAWNVFHPAPSRVGRGRRATVNFVVCFGWGEVFWCSDWHEIVFLFPLHLRPVETLCRTPQAAALCSLLLEAAAAEDASRAAVLVESCDTMRSRKAQCQAPPDNPETGDIHEYHSRERRSFAGQK